MFLLLLAGAALRAWQYAGNPALWMDELALGHNLITRPLGLLLSAPLEDGQVAPPGYLVVARLAVVALGSSEYVLRLFPFLCAIAALPLFGSIALRVLQPLGAVVATALFALSSGVILYAGEAKQYAIDLVAALALTALALRWLDARTQRSALALLGAGLVAEWFSQPAVLVLAAIGPVLLLRSRREECTPVAWMLGLWLVNGALCVLYARARVSAGLMAYMQNFWRAGLMPWPPQLPADLLWPAQVLEKLFGVFLEYPWPLLYLLVACLGAASLLVRNREPGLILLAPLLVTLVAGMARLYPFFLRLVLFLVPAALIFVGEGAHRIARWVRAPALGHILALAIALPPVVDLMRKPPVWRLDDVRPVLAELQRRRQPGDPVFAYYPAWQALRYYGPRYGLPLDVVELAVCHPTDVRDYLRDLDRYRGRPRLWFFSSFSVPALGEVQAMVEYLDAMGVRGETITAPPNNRPGRGSARDPWEIWRPTVAYLYDLSDPVRLAGASAADQSVPPAPQYQSRRVPRCVYGPLIPHRPTVGTPPAARAE